MAISVTRPVTRQPVRGVTGSSDANFVEFPLLADLNDTTSTYAWTLTRASAKNYFDGNGVLQTAAANQPAFGPDGLGIHDGLTNSISAINFRDFTTWTATNGTVDADSITAIDNTTRTTNTFTATAANATLFQGAITAASAQHAGGVMVKAKVGTSVEVSNDGGTTWSAFTINGATWVKCWHAPTVVNPDFGIRLANSGDAVYLDWGMSYLNAMFPFVLVDGGASTLPDFCTLTDFLMTTTSGAITMTVMTEQFGVDKRAIDADGTSYVGMYIHSSGASVYGIYGKGNNNITGALLENTPIKIGLSRLNGDTHIARNGTTVSPVEADATGVFGVWHLGSLSNNGQSTNGFIKGLKMHQAGISASALAAETA